MTKENTSPSVRKVTVGPDEAGQRLDNFLARHLKGVPTGRLYRIVRKGEVRVNSGRINPRYRLQAGDEVRIPPVRVAEGTPQRFSSAVNALLTESILEETPEYLAINKPSGLAVHGGSGVSFGVIEQLRKSRAEAPYLELVHRLDKETSGVLLVAKKRSALRRLQAAWQEKSIEKKYLALVAGDWKGPRRVQAPLSRSHVNSAERVSRVDPQGKDALSFFEVKKRFGSMTLMEVSIPTGRMHQIRVHSAYVGHPIIGDEKYGDRALNRRLKTRLMLHAASLAWPEGDLHLQAPLPADFLEEIQRIDALLNT